jgi:hypothetical protein
MTTKNASKKNDGAKNTSKKSKKTKAPAPGALTLKTDGATDAIKGRVACRTSVIHEALVKAHNEDVALTVKQITEYVNANWARALNGAPTTLAATASHINTMKGRGYIEKREDERGWRLTKLAIEKLTEK